MRQNCILRKLNIATSCPIGHSNQVCGTALLFLKTRITRQFLSFYTAWATFGLIINHSLYDIIRTQQRFLSDQVHVFTD